MMAVLTAPACNGLLDVEQNGAETLESFYQTDQDAEEAMTAVYSYFKRMYSADASSPWGLKNALSDEIIMSGTNRSESLAATLVNEYAFDITNSQIRTHFDAYYRLIYRANLVINNLDASKSELQAQYINEAKVFRAFAYFDLVTLWGTAPLVLEALREDYKSANATPAELWAQVEKDLTEAIQSGKLTEKTALGDKTACLRVTKQFAQALLGKTYLFEGKYAEAARMLDPVAQSPAYGLMDDYGNYSLARFNYNDEVLFSDSIPNDTNNSTSYPWNIIGWNFNKFDGLKAAGMFHNQVWGRMSPSAAVVRDFQTREPDSKRFHQTIKSYDDLLAMGITLKEDYYGCLGYFNWKYTARAESQMTGARNSAWFYTAHVAMKLPEVLLLAAEAHIRAEGPGAGDAFINKIRERAGVEPLSGATLEDLKWEKRFELYMDGCRYQDLIRWESDNDAIKASVVLADQGADIPTFKGKKSDGTYDVTYQTYIPNHGFKAPKHLLLPFPELETNINPNIVQNDGWK